jgi:hypothetical protein
MSVLEELKRQLPKARHLRVGAAVDTAIRVRDAEQADQSARLVGRRLQFVESQVCASLWPEDIE